MKSEGTDRNEVMKLIRELVADKVLTTEMINALHTALKHFDSLLETSTALFDQDIQEGKWTRNQIWKKCFTLLNENGQNNPDDFRSEFIMNAVHHVQTLPKDHALIRIGIILPRALELHTYSQFYKKSDPKKRLAGVVEELNDLPEYINNRQKLIQDIVSTLNEKENTVQSAIQRYRKKKVHLP